MRPLRNCRLYTFIDTAYLAGRNVVDLAKQLCEGGSDLIQLRAKTSTRDEIRKMGEAILPVTRKAGVSLVINDYVEIARGLGADLCHLGQEDFFEHGFTHVAQLKRPQASCREAQEHAPGPELKIGFSTHAPAQAERAIRAGADYIAIGPVYPTATKPGAKPVTLEYVRWAKSNVLIPWFAIGGITLENLDAVLQAGARRVCVVSAILGAPSVVRACQAYKRSLLSCPLN